MNGVLGVFSPTRDKLYVISAPVHKKKDSHLNPLVDTTTIFDTEKSVFDRFSFTNGHGLHLLREGQVNIDPNRKSPIPLILISEPVIYEGCEWSLSPKPIPKKVEVKELATSPKTSSVLKPKGLRDFLSQFGAPPASSTPLFPESTENDERKVAVQPAKVANLFFEKLKHRTAADIVKALKSFVTSFPTQPLNTLEVQGNTIRTFLNNVERIIMDHPLWRDASEDEMEGVSEGLEKYVATKLFDCTFVRDCQTSKENDILSNRIQLLGFITPQHLEIKPMYINDQTIQFACSELQKLNNYKTPRDKLVSVLNCCKVIYTLINKSNPDGSLSGADEFLPMLIYVTLRANPKHLDTNLQYVQYFRNPSKMMTEAGYYFTNLVSAIAFIKSIDSSSLNISQEEFDTQMERRRFDLTPKEGEIKPTLMKHSNSMLDFTIDEPFATTITIPSDPKEKVATLKGATFLNANVEDLRMGDVTILLQEYKRLAQENEKLRGELKELRGV